jgi:hypothetical protein
MNGMLETKQAEQNGNAHRVGMKCLQLKQRTASVSHVQGRMSGGLPLYERWGGASKGPTAIGGDGNAPLQRAPCHDFNFPQGF